MTIPKPPLFLSLLALALGGCATPGPLHLYSLAPGGTTVHDIAIDRDTARDAPSYLAPGDVLTGFAYDPFTDHFFLRLAPGNHIRVVDRPARKIKLEDVVDNPAAAGAGDMAVDPRSGHMFLVDGRTNVLAEINRYGVFIRRIRLQGGDGPAVAIAYDMGRNQLLVLGEDRRTITVYDRTGKASGKIALERHIAPSIGFDSVRREFYAPLAGAPDSVGVFDERGRCVRTLAIASGDRFIDVGPHSFFRMF